MHKGQRQLLFHEQVISKAQHMHVGGRIITSSYCPRRDAPFANSGLKFATKKRVPIPIYTVHAGGAVPYRPKPLGASVISPSLHCH